MQKKSFNADYDIKNVTKASFVITDAAGKETQFKDIAVFDETALSKGRHTRSVNLKVGNYKLTQFNLYNNTNSNPIFSTPKAGSTQAVNVTKPLDLAFEVKSAVETKTTVEVVSTEGLQPIDFGLAQFIITEAKTIIFTLTILDNAGNALTGANLTAINTASAYTFTQNNLLSISYVQLKELDNYVVNVSLAGYQTLTTTYTKAQLSNQNISITLQNISITLQNISILSTYAYFYTPTSNYCTWEYMVLRNLDYLSIPYLDLSSSLSSVATGKKIKSATLFLCPVEYIPHWGVDRDGIVNVYQTTSTVNISSITWNNKPSYSTTLAGTIANFAERTDQPDGTFAPFVSCDITATVQTMINTKINMGLALTLTSVSTWNKNSAHFFASHNCKDITKRPYLKIEY